MYITISGVDTAGKTTIAKHLSEHFQHQGRKVKYKSEFDIFGLNFLRRFSGRGKIQSFKDKVILERKISFFSQFIYAGYFFVVLVHFFFESVLYAILLRKTVLIRERFFYDFVVSTYTTTGKKTYLYLGRCFPGLGNHFFLDISLDEVLKRASTRSFHFSKSHYYELLESYHFFEKRFIHIDARENIGSIIGKISRILQLKQIGEIAISGIDGAGKSTAIIKLQSRLAEYHIKTYPLHFYYNFIVLKFLKKFRKPKKIDKQKQYSKSIEHEKKSIQQEKSILWKMLVLGDALLQYFFSKIIAPHKMKIYDRFFLDFKVSWDFLGLNYNEEVFEKLPKAKNYFLLVAPPKVLYERKPEHTLEFFEKCYEQYLILAKQYGIVVIDTDKKSEEEVENFIINKLISG